MSVHASGFAQATWDAAKNEAKEILIGYAERRHLPPHSDFVTHIQSTTLESNEYRPDQPNGRVGS